MFTPFLTPYHFRQLNSSHKNHLDTISSIAIIYFILPFFRPSGETTLLPLYGSGSWKPFGNNNVDGGITALLGCFELLCQTLQVLVCSIPAVWHISVWRFCVISRSVTIPYISHWENQSSSLFEPSLPFENVLNPSFPYPIDECMFSPPQVYVYLGSFHVSFF